MHARFPHFTWQRFATQPTGQERTNPSPGNVTFPEFGLSSRLQGDVPGEVLVAISVEDRFLGVILREGLVIRPAIPVVLCTAIGGEMGCLRRASGQDLV